MNELQKLNLKLNIFYVAIVILLIFTGFNLYKNLHKCDACMLYNVNMTHGIGGLYYPEGYYCVWTKDKTQKEIVTSDEHEKCHALIANDKKNHFCVK